MSTKVCVCLCVFYCSSQDLTTVCDTSGCHILRWVSAVLYKLGSQVDRSPECDFSFCTHTSVWCLICSCLCVVVTDSHFFFFSTWSTCTLKTWLHGLCLEMPATLSAMFSPEGRLKGSCNRQMSKMVKDAAVRDGAHRQFPFGGISPELHKKLWWRFDPTSTKIGFRKIPTYMKHISYGDKHVFPLVVRRRVSQETQKQWMTYTSIHGMVHGILNLWGYYWLVVTYLDLESKIKITQ